MIDDKDRSTETPYERFDREVDRLDWWFKFWWWAVMGPMFAYFTFMLSWAFGRYILS